MFHSLWLLILPLSSDATFGSTFVRLCFILEASPSISGNTFSFHPSSRPASNALGCLPWNRRGQTPNFPFALVDSPVLRVGMNDGDGGKYFVPLPRPLLSVLQIFYTSVQFILFHSFTLFLAAPIHSRISTNNVQTILYYRRAVVAQFVPDSRTVELSSRGHEREQRHLVRGMGGG